MPNETKCANCGLEESEHHYNGAAYGVCGKFIPSRSTSRPLAIATKSHCRKGHFYTQKNSLWRVGYKNRLYRACRQCQNAGERMKSRERKLAQSASPEMRCV